MSPRQVRAALRTHFSGLGFIEDRSHFVCQTAELQHTVEMTAVRRLPGTIQVHHEVSLAGQADPLLTEEISSHWHNSPYPRIWLASSIDPSLLLEQVAAICRAFQTRRDLAHFYSDRVRPGAEHLWLDASECNEPKSLSATESSRALRRLAEDVLSGAFTLVSKQADFDLWASARETEGFRHCAYLESNQTCTLAVVVTFSLPARVVAGGLRSEQGIRMMMVAPKRVLLSRGRPMLLPLSVSPWVDCKPARAALVEHLMQHPPHLLPR